MQYEDGERVYTAEFTNEAFETQTKTASYTYETIDTPVISSFGFGVNGPCDAG